MYWVVYSIHFIGQNTINAFNPIPPWNLLPFAHGLVVVLGMWLLCVMVTVTCILSLWKILRYWRPRKDLPNEEADGTRAELLCVGH